MNKCIKIEPQTKVLCQYNSYLLLLKMFPSQNFCFDEDEGHDILKVRCCLRLVLVNKFHILLDQ